MALVAVAADKGAPGVTTASLALAAVWPRPVLLAECDAAGGDLFYRLPGADGRRLDPQRGLLSLAVAARRGIQPHQVWRHTQKLHGGLDILTGLVNAEQAGGLQSLWGQVGKVLAEVPEVDVIADCGRLGADGPFYDMLAHASAVVLIARVTLEDVVRLRDRVIAVGQGLANRRMSGAQIGVVIVADRKHFKRHIAEAGQALAVSGAPARILGGLADEPKTAHMLRGRWSTKLDRSLLIRTAREIAGHIARDVPVRPDAVAGQEQHPPGWWPVEQGTGGQGAGVQGAGTPPQPGPVAGPEPAEQVSGEQVSGEQVPAEQVPGDVVAAAQVAAVNVPAEQVPAGQIAAGSGQAGPVPTGTVPAGTVPAGTVPTAHVTRGQFTAAHGPAGHVRAAAPHAAAPNVAGPAAPVPVAPAGSVPVSPVGPGVPASVAGRVVPGRCALPPVRAGSAGARCARGDRVCAPIAARGRAGTCAGRAVPADAVPAGSGPLGVPVLGVQVTVAPMPFAAAPVPADAMPEHVPPGRPRSEMAVPPSRCRSGHCAGQSRCHQTGSVRPVGGPASAAESEPPVPLPAPAVPYRAEHAAPLRWRADLSPWGPGRPARCQPSGCRPSPRPGLTHATTVPMAAAPTPGQGGEPRWITASSNGSARRLATG